MLRTRLKEILCLKNKSMKSLNKEKDLLFYLLEQNIREYSPTQLSKKTGISNRTARLLSQGFIVPILVKQRIRSYQWSAFSESHREEIIRYFHDAMNEGVYVSDAFLFFVDNSYILLYSVYRGDRMKIRINAGSMIPIYEQIGDQIKECILTGTLQENDNLPSVRALSKELRISALTVKKAYDALEKEGFIATIHGKGSYVLGANTNLMQERRRQEVQSILEQAIQKGRQCGLNTEELKELFAILLEDEI